jgi:hypothetical protein
MKSRPIGPGQSILASQNNDKRDDARASSFLLAHQQLGALSLGTEPTNGQVVPIAINGTTVTVTAVTTIGSTANNVLIGGSALAFVTNLVNFLRRPDLTTSTQVAASGANQTLLSYVGWAWPGSSTTIVPFSLNKNVNGLTGPLTSFNITGITVTSGSWTAQTMQLYVEDGTYYINGTRYLFTGASTPTVTAPSSHPRIDLLTIDTSGTLAWTSGTEVSSPTTPTYPANKLAICELYNVVSETALYDNENQQSGEGYISNDVRPTASYGPVFSAIAEDLAPDVTDTRNIGESSGNEWNNIYGKNIYAATVLQIGGLNAAAAKFGGTGADGALSITSGTTTLSFSSASKLTKNYSSISITGTGVLGFSSAATNGSTAILKCAGNCTITSSTNPCIDVRLMGAGAVTNGYGLVSDVFAGSDGAGRGTGSAGLGGASQTWNTVSAIGDAIPVGPGAGGGTSLGVGGTGGGGLYIQVAGAFNFTGTINASGQAGGNDTAADGGGGGGGGGSVCIVYNTLTANTGTVTVSGGTGGSGHTASIGEVGGGGSGGGAGLAGKGTNGSAGTSNTGGAGGAGGAGLAIVEQNSVFV